jgi:alpha-1,3-glucosyltransferase
MLVYVPALVIFVKTWQGNRSGRTRVSFHFRLLHEHMLISAFKELALLTLLFQPALLLIDFGHFQYNSVMLGKAESLECKLKIHELRSRFYAFGDEFLCYGT